jgi:HD superfamily phosphodiesterase
MSDPASHRAETRWLPLVRPYLEELYDGHWLPSHDPNHHSRVWKNACKIAEHLNPADNYFFEKLLLSCYFHDTGLLTDRSSLHGKESRKVCETFLSVYHDKVKFDTGEILEAIEYHDKKTYQEEQALSSNSVYNVLILADDLDAFGAIGAYRYVEIYLLRNIALEEIPELILQNAEHRYNNCIRPRKFLKVNTKALWKNYETLRRIFLSETFPEGPLSLLTWINNEIVLPRKNPVSCFAKFDIALINNKRIRYFLEYFIKEQ